MESFFNHLMTVPANAVSHLWVYPVLFVMVVIEGPIAILVAATAASTGFLNPLPVFITASLGNLIADILWYFLGVFGRVEWILKLKWLKLEPKKLDVLTKSISKNVVKILIIAKLTNGLIVPALIATGLAKVNIRRWFPSIFFSNLLITGLFVGLGYWTAVNIMKLEHWVKYLALGFSIILIIFTSIYVQHLLSRQTLVDDLIEENNIGQV